MNSSTSNFKRLLPTAIFVLCFVALMVPHELLVRRSEAAYGRDPVLFTPPHTDNGKLDAFVDEVRAGRNYDMYCVGSSVCEYGLHPDVLGGDDVYNLGFSGTSDLCGLEILRRLGIVPKVLVVSVSPFDFTATSNERGGKILAYGAESKSLQDAAPPFDVRAFLERWMRDRVWSVLHSATAVHHRTLPQWIAFLPYWSDQNVLRFLNNAEWQSDDKTWANMRYYVEFCKHGYLGLKLRWRMPPDRFDREAYKPVLDYLETHMVGEYLRDHAKYLDQMRAALDRFHAAGTRIFLVRIPQYAPLDARSDQLIPFDADMRALAASVGATYVDISIVPQSFRNDRDNFRDAEHLHYDSSIVYSTALRPVLSLSGRP